MNHDLFNAWILDGEPLSAQEQRSLQEHLDACADCRMLAEAWQVAQGELRRAPIEKPAPGFTPRWQARLATDEQRRHRQQGGRGLVLSLAGAGLLLGALVALLWPVLEAPSVYFWTMLYALVGWLSAAGQAGELAWGLVKAFSSSFPLVGWVFVAGLASLLSVLWLTWLRLLTNPRRVVS